MQTIIVRTLPVIMAAALAVPALAGPNTGRPPHGAGSRKALAERPQAPHALLGATATETEWIREARPNPFMGKRATRINIRRAPVDPATQPDR